MAEMSLMEWAVAYLRHRDIFERRIESLDEDEDSIAVREKDDSYTCFVGDLHNRMIQEGKVLIITPNAQRNLSFLLTNWDRLAKLPDLRIVFANPRTNEKWVIVPYNHAAIAEEKSLKDGLESLYSTVSSV